MAFNNQPDWKKEMGKDESEDEGEWECERCGEGGKANDGAIKCRCGEEGVWSDDEEEDVEVIMTAAVRRTFSAAEIEAAGGIQSVVTAWMNVKFK